MRVTNRQGTPALYMQEKLQGYTEAKACPDRHASFDKLTRGPHGQLETKAKNGIGKEIFSSHKVPMTAGSTNAACDTIPFWDSRHWATSSVRMNHILCGLEFDKGR